MTREVVAQGPPTVALQRFPTVTLTTAAELFRAHTSAYGPWWFGSDGSGRFDLPRPRGTCYLADSPVVAVRERLGVVLGSRATVPASLLDAVVVSRLAVPTDRALADLQARAASRFGALRELEVMVPYAVPQAWARAFDEAGLGGVAYGPRFSTGPAVSYAVFGPAGSAGWVVDPHAVPAREVPGAPLAVDPPLLSDVTVVRTPRTRKG